MPRAQNLLMTYPSNVPVGVVQPNNVVAVETGSGTRRGSYSTNPGGASGWTVANLPTNHSGVTPAWNGIAYSPSLGRYCAVSDTSDSLAACAVATSDDGGHTWTGRAIPDDGSWGIFSDVCWSPDKSLFVAVAQSGPTTTKRIITSPDGITWTERTIPTASKTLRCVCWSKDLTLFVALGDGNYETYSSDGVTWSDSGISGFSDTNTWQRIVWCGGTIQKFIVVGRGGSTFVAARSSDGKAWTMFDTTSNTWDIAYSPDLGVVAYTRTNSPSINTSTDGTSFTTRTPSGSTTIKGICWSKALSLFVATGTGQDVVTSSDGVTWTNHTGAEVAPNAGNSWSKVAAGNS